MVDFSNHPPIRVHLNSVTQPLLSHSRSDDSFPMGPADEEADSSMLRFYSAQCGFDWTVHCADRTAGDSIYRIDDFPVCGKNPYIVRLTLRNV